ncbi:MAG: hypothetical protein AB7S77_02150 [Desulfatirhabdiaceae bacterium]
MKIPIRFMVSPAMLTAVFIAFQITHPVMRNMTGLPSRHKKMKLSFILPRCIFFKIPPGHYRFAGCCQMPLQPDSKYLWVILTHIKPVISDPYPHERRFNG